MRRVAYPSTMRRAMEKYKPASGYNIKEKKKK